MAATGQRLYIYSLVFALLVLEYSGLLMEPFGSLGVYVPLVVLALVLVSLYIFLSSLSMIQMILALPSIIIGTSSLVRWFLNRSLTSFYSLALVSAMLLILGPLVRAALSKRSALVRDRPEVIREILIRAVRRRGPLVSSLGAALVVYSTTRILGAAAGSEDLWLPFLASLGSFTSSIFSRRTSDLALFPLSWAGALILYTGSASSAYLAGLSRDLGADRLLEIRGAMADDGESLRIPVSTRTSPHIVVSGSTGSGKTSFCKLLATSMGSSGIRVVVIDPHGEYRDLEGFSVVRANNAIPRISPLPGGSGHGSFELVESLRKIFKLGAVQTSVLTAIVERFVKSGGKSFEDMLRIAETMHIEAEDPIVKDSIASLLPYLRILATHLRGDPLDLDEMLSKREGGVVFDVSPVGSDYALAVYVEYLLKRLWIYGTRQGFRDSVGMAIIIDEAHTILTGSVEDFISRIYRESRKYGISMVISTQQIEKLPSDIVNNTGIFILFRHVDPKAVSIISSLTRRDAEDLVDSLKPLQGVAFFTSSGDVVRFSVKFS